MLRASALRRIIAVTASIGLLAALGVGPVSAEVLEDQVQDQYDGLACIQPELPGDCHNALAQTLTVGTTGQLVAIHLPIERSPATTQPLVIEIHAGTPTGALLASSAPVPAADVPTEADWVLFDFPSMPAVASSDEIAIVIPSGSSAGTAEPSWWWGYGEATGYAGGQAWEFVYGQADWIEAPDFDFAFVTYVAAGQPTCELTAYMGESELTPPLEIEVGESFDLLFWDFPPFGDMVVSFAPVGGDPQVEDDVADAFGESWWTWTAETSEIGDWVVTGTAVGTECAATLDVTIVAAPAPTPTPTPPPATPTPTGTAGGITPPPTSTALEPSPGGASVLPAILVLGATLVALLAVTRRLATSPRDR